MKIGRMLRAFLIQSDLSVENGLLRLKPKSSFLLQSKKGFFHSTFFDGEFRLADPVKKLDRLGEGGLCTANAVSVQDDVGSYTCTPHDPGPVTDTSGLNAINNERHRPG